MLDAEIAAILLNRRATDDQAAGELLREGNLHFVAESGGLGPVAADRAQMTVESLLFTDGSRAFRVGGSDAEQRWSRWAVIEPFAPATPAPDALRDRTRNNRGRHFA